MMAAIRSSVQGVITRYDPAMRCFVATRDGWLTGTGPTERDLDRLEDEACEEAAMERERRLAAPRGSRAMTARYYGPSRPRPASYIAALTRWRGLDDARRLSLRRKGLRSCAAIAGYHSRGGR